MSEPSGLLLVGAVAAVGVLHTLVPDHWVPITLLARQRGWSRGETARMAFRAGLGHVLSTLAIALLVWLAGVVAAARFGRWMDTGASLALIGFGGWIALSAWLDLHGDHHHHHHGHHHHGPAHEHAHAPSGAGTRGDRAGSRTALLLILGSSPMVEGIPAFFAAARYGAGLILLMSLVFGASTIATYMLLCVGSSAGLRRLRLGPLERYAEVLSGALIALVGLAFWAWPVM